MFNKDFWRKFIRPMRLDSYPTLPCPYCGQKALVLNMESFQYRTVSADRGTQGILHKTMLYSQKEISDTFGKDKLHGLWMGLLSYSQIAKFEPAKFICFLDCGRCFQTVAGSGSAAVPKLEHIEQEVQIKIEFFSPPIPMFPIVDGIPEAIANELMSAFSHFHSDISSSGTKVRRAAEQYCKELGFTQGTLHHRIEKMGAQYPEEAAWLLSLKLVGNEATHSIGVEEQDLLHSFEIFAELLDLLGRRARLAKVKQSASALENKFKKP